MKVEYERGIVERLIQVRHDALCENKVIKVVRLCQEEWDELYHATISEVFDYHAWKKTLKVVYCGMDIELTGKELSHVLTHLPEEDTGYPLMIRDLESQVVRLQKENSELKKTVTEGLAENNSLAYKLHETQKLLRQSKSSWSRWSIKL